MPTPIVVRRTYIEETPGRLLAVFVLSAQPDPQWITRFRARAWYSAFGVAAARFAGDTARVELPRREDLASLIYSMQRFIEGANLDTDLSGPP